MALGVPYRNIEPWEMRPCQVPTERPGSTGRVSAEYEEPPWRPRPAHAVAIDSTPTERAACWLRHLPHASPRSSLTIADTLKVGPGLVL